MISIVLFQEGSMLRIAKKTVKYFSEINQLRVSENTLWLEGGYIKFSPQLITINQIRPNVYNLQDYLTQILSGEEIYISNDTNGGHYFRSVNSSTLLDVISR